MIIVSKQKKDVLERLFLIEKFPTIFRFRVLCQRRGNKMNLNSEIEMIENDDIREAIRKYIGCLGEELLLSPASRSLHHNYEGGLVKHTKEVVEIGLKIIRTCNLNVNIDEYVVSAIIHDLGKVGIYYYDKKESKWKRKAPDIQIDHSLVPILEFPEKTGFLLSRPIQVAVLGHMGGWSKTSVYPDTLLGAVLHSADLISSRIEPSNGFET